MGVNAFRFTHVVCNQKIEPAKYPDEAKAAFVAGNEVKGWKSANELPGFTGELKEPEMKLEVNTDTGELWSNCTLFDK